MERKLYRDESRKVLGGVCAGLADYFNTDVSIVRLVFLLTLILKGGGGLIYIILWIVLPRRNYYPGGNQPFVDYRVPPEGASQPFTDYSVPPVPPTSGEFIKPKGPSTGSVIVGLVLVMIGAFFILDDFNIIPDWDFEHFWPVILITVGLVFVLTGSRKQPWEKDGWNKKDNPSDNNPPTA